MNNYEIPLSSDINTSPNPNSQTEDNPYFIVPVDSVQDQISIPKVKACFFVTLFVSIFFMLVPLIQLIPLGAAQFYAPGIIVVIIIILLCFKSKVVLIKDKENNTLIVKEQNFFCCTTQSRNITLEHLVLKISNNFVFDRCCICHLCKANTLLALNVDPNVTDIDNNNIKNTPFKFINIITNINDGPDIQFNIESFIGKKFNNNIMEQINLYNPNKNNFNYFFNKPDNVFVKISDHFYMFYNYRYLDTNSTKESFQRLDWIYTNNFDRIFIGVIKDDTTYINNFTYNIVELDKFIVEIRGDSLCLKVILKTEAKFDICRYTREKKRDLDTFIYLINGQINKINNGNNQDVPEKPELDDNSAPTIK